MGSQSGRELMSKVIFWMSKAARRNDWMGRIIAPEAGCRYACFVFLYYLAVTKYEQ